MEQSGCSCRLPQPRQLMMRDELLGYHNNKMNIFSVVHMSTISFKIQKSTFSHSYEANYSTDAPACIVISSCLMIGCKMAALEMPANGEASHNVGEDIIHKALDSVEDRLQKVPQR